MRGGVAFGLVGLLALSALVACGDDDDKGSAATTTAGASATTTAASTSGSTGATSGGDASSATEDEYEAAIEDQFTSGDSESEQMTDEQAKCVAPKWLDVITVDRLHEKNVTPDAIRNDASGDVLSALGLTDADGKKMFDAFGACDINVRDEVVASLASQTELTSEVQDCLKDAFDDDLLERVFVATTTKGSSALDQDQKLATDFTNAIGKCVPQSSTG